GTTTAKGQRYTKAGDNASAFGVNAKPQSYQPMTASAVMTAVAMGTPTSAAANATAFLHEDDPQWLRSAHTRAQTMAAEAAQHDFVTRRTAATDATGLTISGSYSDTIGTPALTLNGTITFDGANASVTFTSITGTLGDIQIVLSKPTGVSSDLFNAIAQA